MGDLIAFPKGGINAEEYINTLRSTLLPFILKLNYGDFSINEDTIMVTDIGHYIFMQDNMLIHTVRSTMSFLNDYYIMVMNWPTNSPDLNPIEHLWHALKVKFHCEFFEACHLSASRAEAALATYIAGPVWVWNTQLGNLPQRLVASMLDRVAEVIKAQGGHTHY